MPVEDEERTRLVDELVAVRIVMMSRTTIEDVWKDLKRAADISATIAALDADARAAAEAASHYDSSTTTAPVIPGDEYDSAKVIEDAEARRLMAIEYQPEVVREVEVGELLNPGDWNECFDVTWDFHWGSVALNHGWYRSVTRDIDPKYMLDKAKNLAKSLTDPVQRERLLYTIRQQQNALANNLQLVIDEIEGAS